MQENNIPIVLVNDMPIFFKHSSNEGYPFINEFIEGLLAKREAEKKEADHGNS